MRSNTKTILAAVGIVGFGLAWGSGLGPWYLARAKALSVGLSNAYFKSLGLPTLIDGC